MLSDIVNQQVVGLNRKRNSKSLPDEHGPEVRHFYTDTVFKEQVCKTVIWLRANKNTIFTFLSIGIRNSSLGSSC